jgi:hypothetical protein
VLEHQPSVQDDDRVFGFGLPWDEASKHGYLANVCYSSLKGQSLGEQDRAALRNVHVYSPESEPLPQGVNCVWKRRLVLASVHLNREQERSQE